MARVTEPDVLAAAGSTPSDAGQTLVGALVGTLAYMSPEQFDDDSRSVVDRRADIYALGVLLFELLAGRPPIDVRGLSLAEITRRVREEEPPPLGSLAPACRGDVETIVTRAMQKRPADRYASVGEFGDDLRRYLANEPIQARRPTAHYRLRKFARRHRPLVAAGAGLVLALILSATLAVRAGSARRLAGEQAQAATAAREAGERLRLAGLAETYQANVKAAYEAWQDNQVALAARLLNEAAAGRAGDPDLRGWEWRYLHRLAHPVFRAGTYGRGQPGCLAVSPDGRRAVTGGGDGTLHVWSLDETADDPAAPLRQVSQWTAHGGDVTAVRWTGDGRRIVSSSWDGRAAVWDAATGAALQSPPESDQPVLGVDVAGSLAVAALVPNRVRISDAATGRTRLEVSNDASRASAVALSADGRRLAAGSETGQITVWTLSPDAAATTPPTAPPLRLNAGGGWVSGLAFSPDGRSLVSAQPDAVARV